jgi:transcriptional regulator with XRE-family HTH domain
VSGEAAAGKKKEPFGARLRRLRKAKGFTQAELAEAIGSSQRMVTYYETHDGIPAAPILLRMAGILGVEPDELLGMKSGRRRKALETPENIRLWRKLRLVEQLPTGERRHLLQIIEAMVERHALKQKAS